WPRRDQCRGRRRRARQGEHRPASGPGHHGREHAQHGRDDAGARAAAPAAVPGRAGPRADHRGQQREEAGRPGRGCDRLDRQALRPGPVAGDDREGTRLISAARPAGRGHAREGFVEMLDTARLREFEFTDADFNSLRRLVREVAGISLADCKRELVYSRLARRLRHLGLTSFASYREFLASEAGQAELREFTNAVTTNLTAFFRERHHFDYLRDALLVPRMADPLSSRRIRIWCSAVSTGEEAYSVAMTVAETVPDWRRWDIRILATDLDTNVLAAAESG